jgi:hypothetical protein
VPKNYIIMRPVLCFQSDKTKVVVEYLYILKFFLDLRFSRTARAASLIYGA